MTRNWGGASAESEVATILTKIGVSDNPIELVEHLAPHDLLVAWNIADDEQRGDLLRLASLEQWNLLVDLRCWQTDKPDLEILDKTLAPLAASGIGGAVNAMEKLGDELRTLLLKRHVRIHLLDNRNDEIPAEDDSEIMSFPDGLYHLEIPDADAVTDTERALWQAMMMQPFEAYQPELECIRHDMISELEETALRWRNGRLSDFGFATREEAIEMLIPRSVQEVLEMAEKAEIIFHPPMEGTLPVLYRENLAGNEFFDEVVKTLLGDNEPRVVARMEGWEAELSAMNSRFLAAIGTDLGDIEAIKRGSKWARNLMTLGLFEASKGDVNKGAELLAALPPGVFVQLALGTLYPLRERARAMLRDNRLTSMGQIGAAFDAPYYSVLTCLAQDIPARWPKLFEEVGLDTAADLFHPLPTELMAFASPEEVEQTKLLLEESEQLAMLLFDTLGCSVPLPDATAGSIFVLTALANAAGDRNPVPNPLLFEEATLFGEQVTAMDKDQFLEDSLMVLSESFKTTADGTHHLSEETDPRRRLLIRLLLIGYTRLKADSAEKVLLIES